MKGCIGRCTQMILCFRCYAERSQSYMTHHRSKPRTLGYNGRVAFEPLQSHLIFRRRGSTRGLATPRSPNGKSVRSPLHRPDFDEPDLTIFIANLTYDLFFLLLRDTLPPTVAASAAAEAAFRGCAHRGEARLSWAEGCGQHQQQ
jgi:hypothetical protein